MQEDNNKKNNNELELDTDSIEYTIINKKKIRKSTISIILAYAEVINSKTATDKQKSTALKSIKKISPCYQYMNPLLYHKD